MGSAMAPHLATAGHRLTVYNRTTSKAKGLAEAGARIATTPAEAAQGDIVITMLANDAAAEDVAFGDHGLLQGMAEGCIHISMSTISVALSKRLAEAHAGKGQVYVAAPVFGRPDAAAAAKLLIAAAGPSEAIDRCQPVFDALGRKTIRFGEEAWKANLIKLSGNFLISSAIESLAEAFALTGKAGIEPQDYLELVGNLFSVPMYEIYGGLVAEERYQPAGFTARLGRKDVALLQEAAETLQVPMPVASLLAQRYLALLAAGCAELDWSAIGKLAKRDAGDDTPLAPR